MAAPEGWDHLTQPKPATAEPQGLTPAQVPLKQTHKTPADKYKKFRQPSAIKKIKAPVIHNCSLWPVLIAYWVII